MSPTQLFVAGIAMNVFGPDESSCFCVSGAQIENLRSPFQLLLMSCVQCGEGAAGTDAEDEEHKQFSHASPSSLVGAFQSASI